MALEVSPTARALLALEAIQNVPGITAQQLGDRLGVTERAARRYVAILREAGIPKAQAAASEIEQGYGAGRFSLLEVLDAQANVTQARLREQEAQQNYHVAVATIEGLVGNPFALARESRR